MTIFEKIINREIPSFIIWEDEKHIAFLDNFPVREGHTLVVTKHPYENILDLNDEEYSELMLAAKKIAHKLKDKLNPVRVGIVVEGFGVPHVHVHLIPIDKKEDIKSESQSVSPEYLKSVYNKIMD